MEETLTTQFSNRALLRLVGPLVMEQFLSIAVGLSDSLMVAQVGEAAVSGVSLVDTVNVLLVNAFASLATGGAGVAGQYIGHKVLGKARRAAHQLRRCAGAARRPHDSRGQIRRRAADGDHPAACARSRRAHRFFQVRYVQTISIKRRYFQ